MLESDLDLQSRYRVSLDDENNGTEYSSSDVVYALQKLEEAGFVNAKITRTLNGGIFVFVTDITWYGHEFLDNIRPQTAWEKTKGVVSQIGGASLNIMSTVASKVITELIHNQLGF